MPRGKGGGGGVTPSYHMGYVGMCGPKGYVFLTVLVKDRLTVLAILVSNKA